MAAPRVTMVDANDNPLYVPAADGMSSPVPATVALEFNGVNYDRPRSAQDMTLITATAATTSRGSGDLVNYDGRGVKVALNVTAAGSGSITVSVQGKDAASGAYYTLLAGAAVTGNGLTLYTVHPAVAAVANVSANDVLPHTWRVLVTANNANPVSYTVGAALLP